MVEDRVPAKAGAAGVQWQRPEGENAAKDGAVLSEGVNNLRQMAIEKGVNIKGGLDPQTAAGLSS